MKISKNYLYLLSFYEGGAVMSAELVGAKMLAPVFGTSLYVWASTLGITLGGLALGYFLGGWLSTRSKDNIKTCLFVMLFAGFFLISMPMISSSILYKLIHLPLITGTIVSLLIFLLPPLIFMGMVSPLIINILTEMPGTAGSNSGKIYAISTVGGILFTFLFGFFLIPEFGIKIPIIITGVLFILLVLVLFLLNSLMKNSLFILILTIFLSIGSSKISSESINKNVDLILQKDGILGQIKVVEFKAENNEKVRALLVNNTLQTVEYINRENDVPYWNYINYIEELLPKVDTKGLLLGVGGGTLLKKLDKMGYTVDAVDFDENVVDVAKEYFGLEKDRHVYTADARQFINQAKRDHYDFIIVDVLKGETVAEHLMTRESFMKLFDALRSDGIVIINFYGYLDGNNGLALRSVVKTLNHCNFSTDVYVTPGLQKDRNTVLYASKINLNKVNSALPKIEIRDTINAFILTDENPRSKIYVAPAMEWRKMHNEWYSRTIGNG